MIERHPVGLDLCEGKGTVHAVEGHKKHSLLTLVDGRPDKVWSLESQRASKFLIHQEDPDEHFGVMRGWSARGEPGAGHSTRPEDFFFLAARSRC